MSGILQVLLAGSGGGVDAQNVSAVDTTKAGVGGTDSVTIAFNSSGNCTQIGGTSVSGTFAWLLFGANSDYDILLNSITPGPGEDNPNSGPALDTWHNLGTTRSWVLSTTNDDIEFDSTYEIRNAATLAVIDTGTIAMRCFTAP